jgi:hypothetical protein
MFAHSAVGEVLLGIRILSGNATVAIPVEANTSREPRASSAFMATGSCPTRPKEIPRIFAPLALFREIPSCSVLLRRCAAVHRSPATVRSPLVPMPEIPVPRLAA